MTRTDISIHALREEGDVERCKKIILAMSISIHALREEGDLMRVYRMEGDGDFYPRPPRGGRRFVRGIHLHLRRFLSTPSARRATAASIAARACSSVFLSTPSARRATGGCLLCGCAMEFLSTPSARRATDFSRIFGDFDGYFYPRPPRGGRPAARMICLFVMVFLSTPSARRATQT